MLSPVTHADPTAQLDMEVTLRLCNRAALDQLLQDQQNPASPRYHQMAHLGAVHTCASGPRSATFDAVAQWLNAQGFKVSATSLAQRYVRFSGAISDAERAFAATIITFGDGTAYSNICPAISALQRCDQRDRRAVQLHAYGRGVLLASHQKTQAASALTVGSAGLARFRFGAFNA